MTRPRIGIRTVAGARIGTGHLRRCETLAEALTAETDVELLVAPDEPGTKASVFGHRAVPPSFDGLASVAHYRGFSAIIVDDYALTDELLQSCAPRWPLTFVIDDLATRQLEHAFGILNPTVGVSAADYPKASGKHLMLGPNYALLRRDFASVPERKHAPNVGQVLVTTGGSDPGDHTPVIVRTALSAMPDAAFDVVVGPLFSARCRTLLAAIAESNSRVTLHAAPSNLLPLMRRCDLAISAAGQTLFELGASGTPTVAVAIANNQRRNLQAMSEAGMVMAAVPSLTDAIVAVQSIEKRQSLSSRARQVVDGLGAERAAKAIVSAVLS